MVLPDPRPILHTMLGALPPFGRFAGPVRAALRWAAHHSGLPAILIAGVTLVVSWRLLRRSLGVTVELILAVGLLAVATHLGWIRW